MSETSEALWTYCTCGVIPHLETCPRTPRPCRCGMIHDGPRCLNTYPLERLDTIKQAFAIVRGEAIPCPRCRGEGMENTCYNPDDDPSLRVRCPQCGGRVFAIVPVTPEHRAIVELCEAHGITFEETCRAVSDSGFVHGLRCQKPPNHGGWWHTSITGEHFHARPPVGDPDRDAR